MIIGRCLNKFLVVLAVILMASCNSQPTTVTPADLELIIASGDGQFGSIGTQLRNSLRVIVRAADSGSPQESIAVLWSIVQGDATLVGPTTTVSDSTGSSEVDVLLGNSPGSVMIRASVVEHPNSGTVTFEAFAVLSPILSQVTPTSASAGSTVTLSGSNFSSEVAIENIVLFSGVRGRVMASSPTSLRVEVPECLPTREVEVRVQLGTVSSQLQSFAVTGDGQITTLQVGEVLEFSDDGGFECHTLSGGSGVEYLTVVYSGSTVEAAEHPFELTALSSSGPSVVTTRAFPASSEVSVEVDLNATSDPQIAWDQHLRNLEADLVREDRGDRPSQIRPVVGSSGQVPVRGEVRSFSVLNVDGGFDEVTAVARYVGSEAAIFVDQNAPYGGFTTDSLQAFAERFDQVIHPELTSRFGATSDLDSNQRVVILFTPVVNSLTPRGSSGFVGGFFFGLDLLPNEPGSNGGEVFYSLVPDPGGQFSDPQPIRQVLQAVPSILAHEFQHMVTFNQRTLVLGAERSEELWLSEGLAQMAEEIVARAYDTLGNTPSSELFRSGTRLRARHYLTKTDTVSTIVTTGQGSLAERGAGFLQVLYIEDQGNDDILARLSQTTRTGVNNVIAEFGGTWTELLADWWSAMYLDGLEITTGPLVYQDFDLRAFLGTPYPLEPAVVGPNDFSGSGRLRSSAAAYYLMVPGAEGSTTLRLGGEAGGASLTQSDMRMWVVRVS